MESRRITQAAASPSLQKQHNWSAGSVPTKNAIAGRQTASRPTSPLTTTALESPAPPIADPSPEFAGNLSPARSGSIGPSRANSIVAAASLGALLRAASPDAVQQPAASAGGPAPSFWSPGSSQASQATLTASDGQCTPVAALTPVYEQRTPLRSEPRSAMRLAAEARLKAEARQQAEARLALAARSSQPQQQDGRGGVHIAVTALPPPRFGAAAGAAPAQSPLRWTLVAQPPAQQTPAPAAAPAAALLPADVAVRARSSIQALQREIHSSPAAQMAAAKGFASNISPAASTSPQSTSPPPAARTTFAIAAAVAASAEPARNAAAALPAGFLQRPAASPQPSASVASSRRSQIPLRQALQAKFQNVANGPNATAASKRSSPAHSPLSTGSSLPTSPLGGASVVASNDVRSQRSPSASTPADRRGEASSATKRGRQAGGSYAAMASSPLSSGVFAQRGAAPAPAHGKQSAGAGASAGSLESELRQLLQRQTAALQRQVEAEGNVSGSLSRGAGGGSADGDLQAMLQQQEHLLELIRLRQVVMARQHGSAA